ncbi:unnamed protein product [Amoebophrya sp. A25]|nr:unnamed protein product [Amoebophrya sp. A25]|eukprot:GSA25T00009770001.1
MVGALRARNVCGDRVAREHNDDNCVAVMIVRVWETGATDEGANLYYFNKNYRSFAFRVSKVKGFEFFGHPRAQMKHSRTQGERCGLISLG